MKKHWLYLKYVLKHKYYVGRACFRRGLYWRGIIHDWSKFTPTEWFPYVEYFYGKTGNKTILTQEEFDLAWNSHQKVNKHHWQYWYLVPDNGKPRALMMEEKYRLEMLADWEGVGFALFGKNDSKNWYLKNRDKIILHPMTRIFVEQDLGIIP
jgi:hypothetical protein